MKRNWIYVPIILIVLLLVWYFHTIIVYILVAGSVGGIAGMILAVPVYSVARVFIGEFFNQFKAVKALTGKS